MRADMHMHSNFSHDSEFTPEQMVLGAIDKGLKVICFTDHYDKDDLLKYLFEILELIKKIGYNVNMSLLMNQFLIDLNGGI